MPDDDGPAASRPLLGLTERLLAERDALRLEVERLRGVIVRHVEGTGNLLMRENLEICRVYREIKASG